jgi:nitroreductase
MKGTYNMENPTLETIGRLRTIHWNFNGKKVSDSDLRNIIGHGMRSAHSTNLSDYSVVVVDDTDKIKKLTANTGKARCCVFCIDHTRTVAAMKLLGHEYTPDSSWYTLFADLYNVYAFAQTSIVAAKSMGIDSLVTNGIFRVDINEAKELLNLPEKHCFPVIAVLFGYSDKPEEEITGRISASHILHFGGYNPASENGLREIIGEMDNIYPEYTGDKYLHTLDWYFNEWLGNGTGKLAPVDAHLRDALVKSGYVF